MAERRDLHIDAFLMAMAVGIITAVTVIVMLTGCSSVTPDKIGLAPFYTQSQADSGLIESDGEAYGLTVYAEWQLRPQRVQFMDELGQAIRARDWQPTFDPTPVTVEVAPGDHVHEEDPEPGGANWWLYGGGSALLATILGSLGIRRRKNGTTPTPAE